MKQKFAKTTWSDNSHISESQQRVLNGERVLQAKQTVTFRKACTKRPLHLWLFSSLEKSYVCWGCIAVAAPGVAVIRAELSASAPDR